MDGPAEPSGQHVCQPTAWRCLGPEDVAASIGTRFRAQVEAHPGCLAVKDGEETLTYAELDGWVGTLAARLADVGAADGGRVVQLLDQGAASVAATLGTLVAGAVHVPLDAGEPDARLRALLDRVGPSAVVTDEAGATRLADLGVDVPVLLAGERRVGGPRGSWVVTPDAVATIYFTSGSTGSPKGVIDRHRNIVHNALRYTLALGITPSDRLSLVQPPSSSAVMSSTFAALLNGAALFPYRLDVAGVGALASWVRDERITVYHSVPSILRRALAFGGVLPDVRVVRLEGDRSLGQDMTTWRRHFLPGTRIANGLGTTETGLCRQLVMPVETEVPDGIMPVGYAVADMDASVEDERGGEVAAGEVGGIVITSPYLAVGYLDDGALTDAAFGEVAGRPGVRSYRTGDLGRFRPDGCLEYLGRADAQSKVLGHRVEPAEVEAALATIPGVQAVAAKVVADDSGEGRVIAWVVTSDGTDDAALRAGAVARLPGYMRPTRYVRVPELPLATSGKVERAALTVPAAATGRATLRGEPLEAQVMTIVRRTLGHQVGPDDDFFAVGGDSLGALDVVLGLERLLGRRLPPALLLGAPTVGRLTRVLADGGADARASLMTLASSETGTTLVLLPSHHGHPLGYAALARHLDGVRPVLASDVSTVEGVADSFDQVADRHLEAILGARPRGPYVLGGFCFGGAMAYELTRRLMDAGDPPAGLFLLAVSPYDLPDVVRPADVVRWERSVTRLGMAHRAVRFGRELVGPVGRAYAMGRAAQEARSLREWTSSDGRGVRRARRERDRSTPATNGRYRGPALPVPVTVILPARSAAAYTDDPNATWADVGSSVDVRVVPGVERMLLREPVVATVAEAMSVNPG